MHVACHHHDSAGVVQHLISLNEAALDAVDRQRNTALHHACHGAKHDTIGLLLEKYDAASVSNRNAHGKLPFDLLWESNEVSDRESVEYTESVFRLLRAYPNYDQQFDNKAASRCRCGCNMPWKEEKVGKSLKLIF